MKKYNIIIEETLFKIVRVSAESYDDAIDKVESLYGNQEIVLGADDFAGYEIMGYGERLDNPDLTTDETCPVDIDFTKKEDM